VIVGKTNLLVVGVTADDKRIPVLDNVYMAEDGSTVGSNGRVVLLVSPVHEQVRNNVPIEESYGGGGVAVEAKAVREAIRNMPRDTMFGGLLEHCDIKSFRGDKSSTQLITSDGHRKRQLSGRVWPRDYINYKKIVRLAFQNETAGRVVLNLKRMLSLLISINKICADPSGETPIYLEFTNAGTIIVRATNRRMRQDVMGIMVTYTGTEGKWKNLSDWERGLTSKKTNIKRSRYKKSLAGIQKGRYTRHITKSRITYEKEAVRQAKKSINRHEKI